MVMLKFQSVTAPAATPHDEIRGEQLIDDLLSALPLTCATGDELFSTVVKGIGYASADRTLRAMLRRIQKELERRRS